MTGHVLYQPSDFSGENMDSGNKVAHLVCEGGLGICKLCGAGESELDDFKSCEEYREHLKGGL